MKIFFSGSLKACNKYKIEFTKIYDAIEKLGHTNLCELAVHEYPHELSETESQEIHSNLSKKLCEAHIVVVETTANSLTMGFYIKMALDLDKPVIVLHQPGATPHYLQGIQNDRLQILEYSLSTIKEVLPIALDYAKENLDVRFNLFISSEINSYLRWASKKTHSMRSSFVRNLILEHKHLHLMEYEADLGK